MATLTAADRAEIASKLCLKAISGNTDSLIPRSSQINAAFWAWYSQHLSEDLPLTKEQIVVNLQRGTLQGTSQYTPQQRNANGGGGSSSWTWGTEEDISLRKFMWDLKNDTVWRQLFTNGICNLSINDRLKYSPSRHTVLTIDLNLVFRSPHTVPTIHNFGFQIPAHQPKIIEEASSLCNEVRTVIESALRFHDEVSTLLASVKTDRQLLDLMPEAAPFIPFKEPKTKALVPVEFANSLREKLAEGVPSEDRKRK